MNNSKFRLAEIVFLSDSNLEGVVQKIKTLGEDGWKVESLRISGLDRPFLYRAKISRGGGNCNIEAFLYGDKVKVRIINDDGNNKLMLGIAKYFE